MKLGLVSLLVFVLSQASVLACGFKAKGLNSTNEAKLREVLREVNPEFELNSQTGEIKFTSKERVSLDQIEASLKKNQLNEIQVSAVAH